MANFNLDIQGLDYLVKRFETAPKTVERKLYSKISKYLNLINREAQKNAPYDTGALRESIRAYTLRNPLGGLLVAGNPSRTNSKGKKINYAGYQEFGVGHGFGIPPFSSINRTEVLNYASLFRTGKGIKKSHVPYRSFMFTSLDKYYDKMIRDIATIEI